MSETPSAERIAEIRANLSAGENADPSCRNCNEHVLLAEIDRQTVQLQEANAQVADAVMLHQDTIKERDEARRLVAAVADWAVSEGGWRLFYYSEAPPAGVFDLSDRFNPEVAEPWRALLGQPADREAK